jgi:hypothetical protein
VTINPLGCPPWSTEHESSQTRTHDSYTTPRDATLEHGQELWKEVDRDDLGIEFPCQNERRGTGAATDVSDFQAVSIPKAGQFDGTMSLCVTTRPLSIGLQMKINQQLQVVHPAPFEPIGCSR